MAEGGQRILRRGVTRVERMSWSDVRLYDALRWLLILLIVVQLVRFIWMVLTPVAPLGDWKAQQVATIPVAERIALFRSFDPFDRSAVASGEAAVTSLDLTLYGLRMNEASGQGSAILASSDGVQRSYRVGEEVVPGVTLAAVRFDHVELDRNGVRESLFIDQSIPAETVGTEPANATASTGAAPAAEAAPVLSADAIAKAINFAPRNENGRVTGFAVSSQGDDRLFNAAGFRTGDILVQINGRDVSSTQDINNLRQQIRPGARLSLTVERGTERVPIAIVIPES